MGLFLLIPFISIAQEELTDTTIVIDSVNAKRIQAINTLPDGTVFADSSERNAKSELLQLGQSSGGIDKGLLSFLDFPASNIDEKSRVFFGIEDRDYNARFWMFASAGGSSEFRVFNNVQEKAFQVYNNDNYTSVKLNKIDSKLLIGGETFYDDHKLIVKDGSASIEGDIVSTGNLGIGTTEPEAMIHVQDENVGVKTTYGAAVFESDNMVMDLISTPKDSWGSAINFIEGNVSENTDMWSIARQTTNGSGDSSLRFSFGSDPQSYVVNTPKVTFTKDGKVGIGTIAPTENLEVVGSTKIQEILYVSNTELVEDDSYKLVVGGKGVMEELKVALQGTTEWPDYVFAKDYSLPNLVEVEEYIKENGHLENIPTTKEVSENGIMLGEMNAKLLEKIEELTLYTIEQEKKLQAQESRLVKLEALLLK